MNDKIENSLVDLKALVKERSKRERQLVVSPDFMDIVCAHIASGGTLITLCEIWDVSFGRIATVINNDKVMQKQMQDAYIARSEWAREKILHELRCLAHFDIRDIIDDKGSLKPTHEWPAHAAKAIESIDIAEMFEGHGDEREMVGLMKKVKMSSKLKALELLGKTEAMFVERHEVNHTMSLADMVDASWKEIEDVGP